MQTKLYTTGEMVDIITCDKYLIFEAVNGIYDGGIVSYNDHMEWLMWKDDNTYIPISFNGEFMKTKWRILKMEYAYVINVPIIDSRNIYITCH